MVRPYVPHVNIDEIEPSSRAPGRFSYMLNRDPELTARTAVQRIVPAPDFKPEAMAHFHKTTEEILVLEGLMSFDSRIWLTPFSYVYHPAEFVHGFASAIPVETLYISRVGADLDFTYVPEPLERTPYFVGEGDLPGRGLEYRANALGGVWRRVAPLGREGPPSWLSVLSLDPKTGEGTAFLRLEVGARMDGLTDDTDREIFVLEGRMTADDATEFRKYSYGCWPSGYGQPGFATDRGALLYIHCQRGLDSFLKQAGICDLAQLEADGAP